MIEVITGGMYSGKTNTFIERVRELEKEGKRVLRLKPIQNDRYAKNDIVSHDGHRIRAVAIEDVAELTEMVEEEACDVLAVDEVQFFGWDFVILVNQLAEEGLHLLLAGVDQDFTGRPFGIMPELMVYADIMRKLNGTCQICGELASRSQRLVYGEPAKAHEPVMQTEDENTTYEARCRKHHIVPVE